MTITVGIDTYISLLDAQAYALENGLTLGANDAATEALLKKSTQALDRLYGNQYLGIKATEAQTLAWPRNYINSTVNVPHFAGEWPYVTVDSDGNPRDFSGLQPETGYATVELSAMIQSGTDPYKQPLPFLSQLRQKVATLEEEKQFKGSTGYQENPIYRIVLILRPLLKSIGGSIPITRGA